MKLHLNLSLRRALLAAMAILTTISATASAGVIHSDVSFQTYADFGQNLGRYAVGDNVNALLQYIRQEEGGILINYTDGSAPYIIPLQQGMIDFGSTHDGGHSGMVGANFLATVRHNGSISGTFTAREVGADHAISYTGIDIKSNGEKYTPFRLVPDNGNNDTYDYMLQRMSKIVTDTSWTPVTTVTDIASLKGTHLYHAGAGTMYLHNEEDESVRDLATAYLYITGHINQITGAERHGNTTNISLHQNPNFYSGPGATPENPLPFGMKPGDSGSPSFIYNSVTGQYEYIAAEQSYGTVQGDSFSYSQSRGDIEWTHATMESFNARPDMSDTSTVYLGIVHSPGDIIEDGKGNRAWIHYGTARDDQGNQLGTYNGIKSGLDTNTWGDLSGIKDTQNWYAYDSATYLQQNKADLFFTQNLVFTASEQLNSIVLDDTVDLGIGYAEFNNGLNLDKTVYTITGKTGAMFNHAGYVINHGAEVHLQLTNPENYMSEWRKTGSGDLYIDGTGNTNAMLNLGGSGTTYLLQNNGFAAYNVAAGSGANVVIKDTSQIVHDFTFIAGGGSLDMHGNSMDWYTTVDGDDRFTINALTEEAIIRNSTGNATLTYMESGETTFLGSFKDSSSGSLNIDYQGSGVWHLHSIHTNLSNNAASGLTVSNGRVILSGTNTIHGMGSASATNTERIFRANDWHYADARMNVHVKNDATFELGSHARLIGDVTVQSGGTFVMRESVQHSKEYVEGGAYLEDTRKYNDFHGLKGNVFLADNAAMLVQFNKGTTADTCYSGNISGSGALTVNSGTDGGRFILAGDNTRHSGMKSVLGGGLIFANEKAIGDTTGNKWLVGSSAYIASELFVEGYDTLAHVDSRSAGVLALSSDYDAALDLSDHADLVLGALEGSVVQYGIKGSRIEYDETGIPVEIKAGDLAPVNGGWRFGGGGGELQVNFRLTGAGNLYLGADSTSRGIVTLANEENDFTGSIIFNGLGITLNASDQALGSATIALSYGNAFTPDSAGMLNRVSTDSEGVLLVDKMGGSDLNLSSHQDLFIGASEDTEYTGHITLGTGTPQYRFSAVNGATFNVSQTIATDSNVVVDGQGYTGGKVLLNLSNEHRGNITVRGNRNAEGTGDIALLFSSDVSTTGTVLLQKGGILDINGRKWTINGQLETVSGSAIADNKDSGTIEYTASSGEYTIASDVTVSRFSKTGNSTLTLTGNVDFHDLNANKGTMNFASESLTITRINKGEGNIRFMLHDGADFASYSIGNLNISSQGTISVDRGVSVTASSISNSGWYQGGTRSYMVDGVLNVTDSCNLNQGSYGEKLSGQGIINVGKHLSISLAGGAATIDVAELNIGGNLSLGCWGYGSCAVNLNGGITSVAGHVYHDSTGHPSSNGDFVIFNINGGELVMKGGGSMTQGHLNLISGKLTQAGGTSTISNTFTMSGGELNIAGGRLNISSAATVTGGAINVTDGTLALTGAGTSLLQGSATTTVSGEGVLDLSAISFTGKGIELGSGGIVFDGGGIAFGALNEGQSYTIFTGGTLQGWNEENLSAADIFINGQSLQDYGRFEYTLGMGTFSYNLTGNLSLVWNGGNEGVWDKEGNVWQDTADNSAEKFVNGDHVTFATDTVLSAVQNDLRVGSLRLQDGVELSLAAQNLRINSMNLAGNSTLNLGSGSYTFGNGSVTNGSVQMNGSVVLAADGEFSVADNAQLKMAKDTNLILQSGTWKLNQEAIGSGEESSIITLAGGSLYLNRGGDNNVQTVHSSLVVNKDGGGISVLRNNSSSESMQRVLSDVQIARGNTLELQQNNWNTIWTINHLEGEGNLTWASTTNHNNTSRLIISGDNEAFAGTITVNRNYTNDSSRVFQAYLELASDKAAANAIISLNTTASSNQQFSRSALAINTANAQIRGLDGDAYAHVYSGAAYSNAASTAAPASTASNILTISGTSSHSYAGTVGTSSETQHLSLVKSGSGSQTFSGETHWGSVTLNDGQLQFSSTGSLNANAVTVNGGVFTIEGNATLNSLTHKGGMLYLKNSSGKQRDIRNLELGNGSTDNAVEMYVHYNTNSTNTTDIGALKVNGAARIGTERSSSCFQGTINIGSLSNAAENSPGILTLTNGSQIDSVTAINLNGGSFSGTLQIESNVAANGNTNRKLAVNINDTNVASGAVIQFMEPSTNNVADRLNNYNALGLGATTVTIAGLSGETAKAANIYAYQIKAGGNFDNKANANDSSTRTLTLNVTSSSPMVTNAAINANINLVKTGTGTQVFTGPSVNFNGSIDLQAGTIAFTDNSRSMLGTASSVAIGNGATLDLSRVQFSESGGIQLGASTSITFSKNAILNFDDLLAGTTYSIFDLSNGGVLNGWQNLTIENFSMNGVSMSSMENVLLQLGANGTLFYSQGSRNLTWNGEAGAMWDTSSTAWLTANQAGAAFQNGDSVTFTGNAELALGTNISAYALNIESGKVIIKDTANYGLNAHAVKVAEHAELQIRYKNGNAAANNVLSRIEMADGAVFSTYDESETKSATSIGVLQLNGEDATLTDANHSGIYSIDTLMLGEGRTHATLNLVKVAGSMNLTTYQLGSSSTPAGNFAGTITLNAYSSSAYDRPAAIILSNKDIAANAVIKLESTSSTSASTVLALGINADNSTIAGLESGKAIGTKAKLFSGSIGASTSQQWNTGNISNSSTRTLTISTAAGADYTFYGEVMSTDSVKLNLGKTGEGAQSFLGSGSFGAVTVNGGTLTLGGSTSAGGAIAINAGKLVVKPNSVFSLNAKVSGNGALEIDGGTLAVGGNNNQWLAVDTTVNSGATLRFSVNNGYDNIDYNALSKSITVNGGTLDFGSTRQTMGAWVLNLSNGANVIGNGGTYNVNGNQQAALDYNNSTGNLINATAGNSTIESKTRLRNGAELTYNVVRDASLNVSGLVHSDDNHNGRIIKAGEGTLALNNAHDDLSKLQVLAGKASIHGSDTYSLRELKASVSAEVGFYAGTTSDTAVKSTVTVSNLATLSGAATLNANLNLEAGATFDIENLEVGPVTLNGLLTFGGSILMGENLCDTVNSMGAWERLTLITGLAGDPFLMQTREIQSRVQASTMFGNIQDKNVYLEYHYINNAGNLVILRIPEPTTATLSLLALTGLCARRRRKD